MLLHEATFDDELKGDAEAKQHCTTSEAIGVGMAMGARRVLLTHFSQRYQKIPVMDDIEGQDLELDKDDGTNGDSPMIAMNPGSATFDSKTSLGEMVESDTGLDEILGADSRPRHQNRSSSRSPKIIKVHSFGSKSQTNDMKVGVAFDYMRVKVRDIALLEKFAPALLKLYETDGESEKVGGGEDGKGKGKGEEKGDKRKGGEFGNGRTGRVKVGEEGRREVRSGRGLTDSEIGPE